MAKNSRLNVRVEKARLLRTLERVVDATEKERRESFPILASFLLEVPGALNGLKIVATDLEVSIVDGCGLVELVSPGRIAVPAAAFRDIVKRLPEEELELEALDNFRLEIRSGEALFKLPGEDPAQFPNVPTCREDVRPFNILAEDLQEVLAAVNHAVCKDPLKTNISGVRLEWDPEEGVLVAAATDGHRLALVGKRLEDPLDAPPLGFTFPRKGIEIAKKLEGILGIRIDARSVYLESGTSSIAVHLVEGDFPAFRGVIPGDHPSIIAVDRAALVGALERVNLLAVKSSIRLEIQDGTLLLRAESIKGEALDSLPVTVEGDDLVARYNAKYLLEALGSLGGGEIFLKYRDADAPLVILPGDLGGYDERVLVVMAMKL